MSSPVPRGPRQAVSAMPVGFLDQTQVRCVHEPRDVDASRLGDMRFERVCACAPMFSGVGLRLARMNARPS